MVTQGMYKVTLKGGPENGELVLLSDVPRTYTPPSYKGSGAYHRKEVDSDVKVGVMVWKEHRNG